VETPEPFFFAQRWPAQTTMGARSTSSERPPGLPALRPEAYFALAFTSISSTSNDSTELGGIDGGAPRSP